MRRYIVPTEGRIAQWRTYFEEAFQEEEHQASLMQVLVSMATWVAFADRYLVKENPMVELLESTMILAAGLADDGSLDASDEVAIGQSAYEFVVSLASYLKGVGILQVPKLVKFEGFTNMDMIVRIFDEGELDEAEERVWLKG